MISVPLLTPYLSSLWLTLVTPTAFTVAKHLIEGLRNPTVITVFEIASALGVGHMELMRPPRKRK